MTQPYPAPLTEITAELTRLCQAQRTGVLRIVTDQNHAASFSLLAGRIVSVRYRIRRNLEALPLLKQVEAGQYSFSDGESSADESAALPSNEEILAQLGQPGATSSAAVSTAPNLTPPVTPEVATEVTAAPPANSAMFSETEKSVLETSLAGYIGPMAAIVCRKTFARATSLTEAVTLLASKIPDAERARQFEREVRSRL